MVAELPPEQHNAAAWTGPDMAARADWRMVLSAADIAEIEAATDALIARDTDIATITAGEFPLPHLGPPAEGPCAGRGAERPRLPC